LRRMISRIRRSLMTANDRMIAWLFEIERYFLERYAGQDMEQKNQEARGICSCKGFHGYKVVKGELVCKVCGRVRK
jgi:uncharacterized protein YjcR